MSKLKSYLIGVPLILLLIVIFLASAVATYFYVIGRDIPPPDVSDFTLPEYDAVPPEENAYTYFIKAKESVVFNHTNEYDGSFSLTIDLTNSTLMAELFTSNAEVFANLRHSAKCKYFIPPKPQNIAEFLKITHDASFIYPFSLVRYKIFYETDNGNFETSFSEIQNTLSIGRLMNDTYFSFVSSLYTHIATISIHDLAKKPQLDEHQLKRLLELIDEMPPNDELCRNFAKAQFSFYNMAFATIKERGIWFACMCNDVSSKYIYRHNYLPNKSLSDLADYYRPLIQNPPTFYSDLDSKFLEHTHDVRPSTLDVYFRKNSLGKHAVRNNLGELNTFINTHFKANTTLAATKIIIACQLFQRANGCKPQTLDELVPDFLPSVPLDPYDGNPFRYTPNEGVIWSVGEKDKITFEIW